MELIQLIKSINDEENLNIATTNLAVFKNTPYNIEIIDEDVEEKRTFHFVFLDKKLNIKKIFRALRNGGYLISLVDFEDNELNDIGFSAISRFDGFLIAKKVHSWNDW